MPVIELEKVCTIDTSIDEAWEALTDISAYGDWNPFVVAAEASGLPTESGTLLTFTVQWRDGGSSTSTEVVTEVQPPSGEQDEPRTASWTYCYKTWMSAIGMIRSERTQVLSQSAGGPVTLTSRIVLSGWGAGGAPVGRIKRGIEDQAEAMKAFLER